MMVGMFIIGFVIFALYMFGLFIIWWGLQFSKRRNGTR